MASGTKGHLDGGLRDLRRSLREFCTDFSSTGWKVSLESMVVRVKHSFLPSIPTVHNSVAGRFF